MSPPIWLNEHGRRVETRSCHVPNCTRERPVRRYRFEHLVMMGWARPRQVIQFVNYCGHSQDFVAWPEADGYWALVPVVEAVAS